ncbi:MAG: hypothetical protein Q8R55_04705, partial [Candidatus Taylorbacteria bacterium]|nr:hypothetical protein [Candidatus Taylorbacteria bacterium]
MKISSCLLLFYLTSTNALAGQVSEDQISKNHDITVTERDLGTEPTRHGAVLLDGDGTAIFLKKFDDSTRTLTIQVFSFDKTKRHLAKGCGLNKKQPLKPSD